MTSFGFCGDAHLAGRRPARARANRSGPPPGTGLTLPALVEITANLFEADGTAPTQDAVAKAIRRSVARVREVGQPAGGWRAVVELARDWRAVVELARDWRLSSGSLTPAIAEIEAGSRP